MERGRGRWSEGEGEGDKGCCWRTGVFFAMMYHPGVDGVGEGLGDTNGEGGGGDWERRRGRKGKSLKTRGNKRMMSSIIGL